MATTSGEGMNRRIRGISARQAARLWSIAGIVAVGVLVPAFASAGPTSAADRETARGLLHDGDQKFDAKDYRAALQSYEAAHVIMGYPTTGLAVAKARAALGLLVEARDVALSVTRMPVIAGEAPAFARAREGAEKLAEELSPRIPTLEITLEGGPSSSENVQLLLDGESIPAAATLGAPRRANPGKHTVTASAPGYLSASREIEVHEGDRATLKVPLAKDIEAATAAPATSLAPGASTLQDASPEAAPGKKSLSPLVYVGFGVGAAGLITGTVTGILHLTKVSKVKSDYCHGGTECRPGYLDAADATKVFATTADIAFGVGLAGVGVGILGLVLSKPHAEASSDAHARPTVTPEIGLGSVGLRGAF